MDRGYRTTNRDRVLRIADRIIACSRGVARAARQSSMNQSSISQSIINDPITNLQFTGRVSVCG
jgi:hypothetical protein